MLLEGITAIGDSVDAFFSSYNGSLLTGSIGIPCCTAIGTELSTSYMRGLFSEALSSGFTLIF